MKVCWFLEEIRAYFIDSAKPSDWDPRLDLSLLEEALYDSIHNGCLLVDVALSDEISPEQFFDQLHRQDSTFFYRYLVYSKLREIGWIITSAAAEGCDYYLYATEVGESHSVSLLSIDYPVSLSAPLAQLSGNSVLEACSSLLIDSSVISSVPYLHNADTSPVFQFQWRDIQRFSRLASIRKKVWNRASLQCSSPIQCNSYQQLLELESQVDLVLAQFDHWNPIRQSSTNGQLIRKK